MSNDDDLDALLDTALDEYSALSEQPVQVTTAHALPTPPTQIPSSSADIDAMANEFLQSMQREGIDVSELTSALSAEMAPSTTTAASSTPSSSSITPRSTRPDDLAATLRAIASSSREASTTTTTTATTTNVANNIAEGDEAMLERVLQQLDSAPEMQGAMQELVQQIMAKEVLYEPMIELRDKYPQWLAEHDRELSTDDRARFARQHELIGQICREYERSTVDYDRLTDLMASVQELGQPPREIVAQLAPELPLDANGQPQLTPESCVIQ